MARVTRASPTPRRARGRDITRACAVVALALGLLSAVFAAFLPCAAAAHTGAPKRAAVAVVVPLRGTVDLATVPLVNRAIDDAERDGAALVLLDIDTFGGRLDAAVAIRDRLLASRVRTVAFVNPRAISAGALVALATETIVMRDGGTIGAATPVELHPGGPSTAVDEKTTSYVRKEFRATAERRGRPLALAEAMVDAAVDVPPAPAGKLLTLTTEEAVEAKIADHRANDIAGALAVVGLAGPELPPPEVRHAAHTWAEHVVRAVTHPIVSTLLMTLGMLGLLVEIRTPGFGIPGLVGIACLALFFGGHSIAALAGYEEILLALVGVVLLALEIFVVPGFGITGVLGIAALVLALTLSILGAGPTTGAVLASLARIGVSFAAAVAALVAVAAALPRTALARGLVLGKSLARTDEGTGAGDESSSAVVTDVGGVGTALTPLRPSGIAAFGGRRIDVVSEGQFLLAGSSVEIVRREGHRVVVRPTPLVPQPAASPAPPLSALSTFSVRRGES